MKISYWLTAALLAVPQLSWGLAAQGKMVFMRELGDEKQVVLADEDGKNLRSLTSGKEWHLYPDISADGSTVAYLEGKSENSLRVVTMNLHSGKIAVLSQPGSNIHPRFSGDARFLAWSSNKHIEMMELATGHKSQIPTQGAGYFPAPASDGSFVVFQEDTSQTNHRIVLLNRDDNSRQIIGDPNGLSMEPTLSANDRWIAFTSQVNGNWDIYVHDLVTNQTVRVTDDPAHDFAPAFRADGTLVFASDRSGSFQLYQIKLDAGLAQQHFTATPFLLAAGDLYSARFSGDTNYAQGLQPHIPMPARSSFGVARVGDRIYIAGGHQGHEHDYPKDSFLARVDYFDLKTHTWGRTTPRPIAAHGYCLVAYGKYLYAFGGFTYAAEYDPQWKSVAQVDRLDTETGVWKTIAQMSSPRSSNVAVLVGDSVYLIGGWDSTPQSKGDLEGRFLRQIDIFNLKSEKMSAAPYTLPDPLRRAFSAVEYNGKVILVGGLGVGSSHFSLLDNVTELDPATGTWRELSPLPFATFAPAAQVLGESLFVFGGMFASNGDYAYVSHIYAMDMNNNSWQHTGRYLTEPKGFAMVVPMSSNELAILGGHSASGDSDAPTATFETFKILHQ